MFRLLLGGFLYLFGLWLFFSSSSLFGFVIGILLSINGLKIIIDSYETIKGKKLFHTEPGFDLFSENNNHIAQRHFLETLQKEFEKKTAIQILIAILASLCTHLAKADGAISEKEMQTLKDSLNEHFSGIVDHNFIARIVRITTNHLNYLNYEQIFNSALDVTKAYLDLVEYLPIHEREQILLLLFTILYEIVLADETVSNSKEAMFSALLDRLGVSLDYQEIIKRTAYYKFSQKKYEKTTVIPQSVKIENAKKLLGLGDEFTKDELEKTWKKFALAYHPDKYHNQGEEVYKLMHQKFIEAKEAYDILSEYIKTKG